MQTKAGGLKIAAARSGVSVEEWQRRTAAGLKWCVNCREWQPRTTFKVDRSRADGLVPSCAESRNRRARELRVPVPAEDRKPMGPPPMAPRDDDKAQARQRINVEVRTGRRPRPNTLPCTDCGHVWKPGERRHEYDHYLGYAAEHHYDVQPVCTLCHHKRDNKRSKAEICPNGHPYTVENTGTHERGRGRRCLTCKQQHDRRKRPRPPGYWAAVNARRRKPAVSLGR